MLVARTLEELNKQGFLSKTFWEKEPEEPEVLFPNKPDEEKKETDKTKWENQRKKIRETAAWNQLTHKMVEINHQIHNRENETNQKNQMKKH